MKNWMKKTRPIGLALAVTSASLVGQVVHAAGDDGDIEIYFVGCAAPTGFHAYLAGGAADAGDNLGATVRYIYPDQLTIPNQVQKVEEAIAAQPDGIILCNYAEDAAYRDVIDFAQQNGVVVGSAVAPAAGSTIRPSDDLFLFRVGSDEFAAGVQTGQRLLDMGVTGRVLVANQQLGTSTCVERANGEVETLLAAGVEAEVIELPTDPGQQTEALVNHLRRLPDTVAITSVCDVPDGILAAKEQSGREDLILTGYDIVSKTLEAIESGEMSFTIDQQQYWRGYMPVLLMVHYAKYGLVQSNYFLTGPAIVDSSNVEQVASLVGQGYR